jgi:exosortase H (IPTLxxWG-CTERM-specific)
LAYTRLTPPGIARSATPGNPARATHRHGRFLAIFGICFLAGYAILMSPWAKPLVVNFDRVLVQTAGILIHLFGGHARAEGTILRDPSSGMAVEMKDGCNGVNVTVLLCAALLAFPASWTLKVKGLLIGVVAIQALNFLRFISLYYLLQYSQAWFDFAHAYLWESLIMLDALAVFWLWVHLVLRSVAMPHRTGNAEA